MFNILFQTNIFRLKNHIDEKIKEVSFILCLFRKENINTVKKYSSSSVIDFASASIHNIEIYSNHVSYPSHTRRCNETSDTRKG